MFLVLGCNIDEYSKPMKYNRHGKNFSCSGYYKGGELYKIICFTEKGDSLLTEEYANEKRSGDYTQWFENGGIKEQGQYLNNWPINIWKEYYVSGKLKSFKYFQMHENLDSSTLYYEKQYNEDGDLLNMRLPIKYRTNSLEDNFRVGQTYDLYIDLIYSEYDSVNSMLLIKSNLESGVESDTVYYEGRSGYLQFTPSKVGTYSISGTYFEVDAEDENPDERRVAEKPFKFDYEAVN